MYAINSTTDRHINNFPLCNPSIYINKLSSKKKKKKKRKDIAYSSIIPPHTQCGEIQRIGSRTMHLHLLQDNVWTPVGGSTTTRWVMLVQLTVTNGQSSVGIRITVDVVNQDLTSTSTPSALG